MPDCGDLTLWDVFVRNARLRGGRTAVVCGGASWTFRDLAERAERLAAALHGAGVARGDRLAVLAHNCHRFLEVLGAAARLGAVLVPLNHRLNAAELAYILRDSEPTVLFFDDGFRDTAVALARDGGVGTLVALGGEVAEAVAYESWLAGATAAAPAEAASADDVLALVYTAAVDGRPRGAMLTHRNFVAQNVQTAQPLELGEDDVYLNLLPLFHVTDLNMACAVLHAGGTNVMTPRFDPAEAWRLVAETRTTLLATFPPMPARLLEALDAGVGDVSSLRRVLGVLEHPDVIGRFRERLGVRWFAGYGQTETAGLVTLALPEDLERKPGTAGRPLALCRVEVVDEAGGILPAGSVGEIVVRGPVAVRGYWRLPEDTARMQRGGWHHTGDLGRLDEDGCLWFVDRKSDKELIKTGGENVYPQEVESVLGAHPAVQEVCVIGVPDPEWGEAVKAVVVPRPGAAVDAEELRNFCRERMAGYKRPRLVELASSLPKTPDGRVDRAQVKAFYGGRR